MAISRMASVWQLNPPVSISTTTGKKPRKRSRMVAPLLTAPLTSFHLCERLSLRLTGDRPGHAFTGPDRDHFVLSEG